MLDDLKYIHQRDKSDALGIAQNQTDQYLHDFGFSWNPSKTIHEVIVAGMGGSGLASKAYANTSSINVPFATLQDYELPDRVNENTLLICSSYSGNTEEVISVFQQAFGEQFADSRPMVVAISSGGKLEELAIQNNVPHLKLPIGYQPRFTFGYQYRALAEVMASTSLVDGEISAIERSSKNLPTHIEGWLPQVPTSRNLAKQIVLDVVGKSPVVYSSTKLFPGAYKWKISFNENAKNIAWCNQFPEFNHNEFLGWSSHPIQKPYAPVFLVSDFDHPRIKKRFSLTSKLLSGKMPTPIVVNVLGETPIERLFFTVALGDFVSLYLALLNNIDPTPVELIEKLKNELN